MASAATPTRLILWKMPTPAMDRRCGPVVPVCCSLCKQGQRFLSSLATTDESSSAAHHRSLRKFVKTSSKHVALDTLSHLLSPTTAHPHLSYHLALPLYLIMSQASWFSWNAKLLADVTALMYKQERFIEAEALILQALKKLPAHDRDLCNFYCHLLHSNAKHRSSKGVFDSLTSLKELLARSSSVYVQKRAYESMISGLCEIGLPGEAEDLMEEMRGVGLKPCGFEFKSLVHAYGRLGLFEDMKRSVTQMEDAGVELDTVCSNMVLSSLGSHKVFSEMVSWLRRMKDSEVSFSIRTYNSVLNSCPTLILLLQDPKTIPLSMEDLMGNLSQEEADLVRELVASSVLDEAMECNFAELKLDLHGMHLSTSCLIFLQWIDRLRLRFSAGDNMVPTQITVVCGSGKHSASRGESPVKGLLREMILRIKCPLRIDRRNLGCFVAKGKVFSDWLC
ncbi:pentatricopeptide repeat-containing protein At2g17033-like [Coffea arabica]|uniref:Pentatricopeptide repeat-containing protein At2g17033-like n=1 Tax=Coffea arabica TaxID=13443 RepID=A0ABM4VSJ3_COFAR